MNILWKRQKGNKQFFKQTKEGLMIPIEYDIIIFRENKTYIAYCPELDVSSCGVSIEQAKENLKTAVRLFIEEAEKLGTLEDILIESGYKKDDFGKWLSPRIIATEVATVA
jgi:predicted RNase H-like HicB family nuclease